MMFSHKLNNWKIFNILESEFIQNICVAVVYGDSGNNALIATYDKVIYALGPNVSKCNGASAASGIFYPVKIGTLCQDNIKTFVCGWDYILGLTNNGLVYLWEHKKYGKQEPNHIQNLTDKFIVDIACGQYHFLALTNKGKVYVWKDRSTIWYQLGSKLTNKIIICISCGKDFSILVTDTGEVYSWGNNTVGQLGSEEPEIENDNVYSNEDIYYNVKTLRKITTLDGIVIEKVVCGYSHVLALSTMGILYVWGENSCGQLGLDTTTNAFAPVQLKTKEMGKVQDVAASSACHISVAIAENNQVFIWGQCMGQNILTPRCTLLKCLHDAFAYYAWPRVTYQSLTFYDSRNSNLITSMRKAFDDPDTSDFIIEVQGKPIYVHKAVLIIRCQYYRTMFQNDWAENSQSIVQYDQFSYNAYKLFLKYLYTDEIDISSDSEIEEVLNLANMCFMSELKNRCSRMLITKISTENVMHLYNMSIKYNVKELQKCCFTRALHHMTEVVQMPDFAELDKNIILDFLIQAAKSYVFKT